MDEKEFVLKNADCTEPANCHLMPCRIEHNKSTVKAREYFWPTIKELNEGGDEDMGREQSKKFKRGEANRTSPIMTASFRGRPLQGRKIQMPSDYRGYLLADGRSQKQFDRFNYWNWDELPNNNDTVVKALNWINISKAIHE